MSTEFPYAEIPSELVSVIGVKDKNTRTYRAEGDAQEFRKWVDAILHHPDFPVVTFTWAPFYVGVSRAAIHKRCAEGKLSVFLFDVRKSMPLLGKVKMRAATFAFLSLDELYTWGEELEQRSALRKGKGGD